MPNRNEETAESALRHVKPQVRAMAAYTLRPSEPRVKLNQNESPYDVPEALKARIAERLADRPWNRYPPFVASSFIGAIIGAIVLLAIGSAMSKR